MSRSIFLPFARCVLRRGVQVLKLSALWMDLVYISAWMMYPHRNIYSRPKSSFLTLCLAAHGSLKFILFSSVFENFCGHVHPQTCSENWPLPTKDYLLARLYLYEMIYSRHYLPLPFEWRVLRGRIKYQNVSFLSAQSFIYLHNDVPSPQFNLIW